MEVGIRDIVVRRMGNGFRGRRGGIGRGIGDMDDYIDDNNLR